MEIMLHQKLMATLENDITAYLEDLLNQQSAKYNQEITLLKNENNDLLKKIQLLENQLKEQQELNQQLTEQCNNDVVPTNCVSLDDLLSIFLPISSENDLHKLMALSELVPISEQRISFNLFEQIYIWNEQHNAISTEDMLTLWISIFEKIPSADCFERTYDLDFHSMFLTVSKDYSTLLIRLLNIYFTTNKDYFYLFYDELINAFIQNKLSKHLKIITIIGLFYYDIYHRYNKDQDFQDFWVNNHSEIATLYSKLLSNTSSNFNDDPQILIKSLQPYDSFLAYFDIDENLEDVYSQLLGFPVSLPSSLTPKHVLSDESILKQLGYQLTNRTEKQRWASLLKATEEIGYNRVAYIIKQHINRNKSRPNYQNAVHTWKKDLHKLTQHFLKEKSL